MPANAANGKRLVIFITLAMMLLSLVIVFFLSQFDSNQSAMERQDGRMMHIARLLIKVLLGLYLIKGSNLARWLAAILFATSAVIDLAAATVMPAEISIVFSTMGVIYLALFLTLVFNPSIRLHFRNRHPLRA